MVPSYIKTKIGDCVGMELSLANSTKNRINVKSIITLKRMDIVICSESMVLYFALKDLVRPRYE